MCFNTRRAITRDYTVYALTMQLCLHKIGAHLLGKLMICIDNAIMFAQNLNAPAEKIKNMH